MNEKYLIFDGKVIIEDQENNKRMCEYHENLNDVLIQENVVEIIKDKINKLLYKQKQLENKTKKPFIPWKFIIMCILLLVVFSIYSIYLSNNLGISINIFLKQTTVSFWVLSSLIPFLIASFDTIIDYFKYNHYKKNLNGILCELVYLKKELVLSEKTLKELKSKLVLKKYVDVDFIYVDDQEKIESLTKNSEYYFLEGYNYKEEKKILKKVRK